MVGEGVDDCGVKECIIPSEACVFPGGARMSLLHELIPVSCGWGLIEPIWKIRKGISKFNLINVLLRRMIHKNKDETRKTSYKNKNHVHINDDEKGDVTNR